MNKYIDLENEEEKAKYFHELAGASRILELLLYTCYQNGLIPSDANSGNKENKKNSIAYVSVDFGKNNLPTLGALMNIIAEIKNSEFNIKCDKDGFHLEISCDSQDSEKMFLEIKEIIEQNTLEKSYNYNYTIISSIYNIAKIIKETIDADVLFATNNKLLGLGKCCISVYKGRQINKINMKKPDKIDVIISKLKKESVLNLPAVFFCTFQELRNFYFELDEIVYTKEQGDENEW